MIKQHVKELSNKSNIQPRFNLLYTDIKNNVVFI